MTTRHDIGHYMDGRVFVAFCKRCSAEGKKLLEDCPQKIETPLDDLLEDMDQLESDWNDRDCD